MHVRMRCMVLHTLHMRKCLGPFLTDEYLLYTKYDCLRTDDNEHAAVILDIRSVRICRAKPLEDWP